MCVECVCVCEIVSIQFILAMSVSPVCLCTKYRHHILCLAISLHPLLSVSMSSVKKFCYLTWGVCILVFMFVLFSVLSFFRFTITILFIIHPNSS